MPPDNFEEPLLSRLYPILDASFRSVRPAAQAVRACAAAGCRLIQLRAKKLSSRDYQTWMKEAVESSEGLGVKLLANDRADVALTTRSAGVHLGQDDLSPIGARKILGPKAIIGFSTHTVEQAREADGLPVDYIAIGPVFATKTKRSAYPPLGPEGVRRARRVVTKPLVAIGGITLENGEEVLEAGADSLAVISALMVGEDIEATARELMERWT